MCILDRYIVRSVLFVLIGCILFFCFLYIIIDIFTHLDEIIKQKVPFSLLTEYYLVYIPFIFTQVTPLACLLATIYTLGNLSRHYEIIALRTAGLSTFRIVRTVIILGILVSMAVFMVNERMVPSSVEIFEKIKINMSKSAKKEEVFNLCIYGLKNRLLFINKLSIKNNTLEGITILEEDKNQNIIRKIVAREGIWQNGNWKFSEMIIYNFDEDGRLKGDIEYYPTEIIDIAETPQDFLKQRKNPQTMSIWQLKKHISRLLNSSAKAVAKNLKIDLYHRIFFSFSSLIITILGIPFALRIKGRSSAFSSLGISFGLSFLYYAMDAISVALGKAGWLSPFISAANTHLIFLFIGGYLICRL
ncbi:MAG: LptF/LptG family permease [Candidatus Omnitrophica bacterium]|nr:LptF/LptG family permease [Candidatus Omnitrophota bacterium]